MKYVCRECDPFRRGVKPCVIISEIVDEEDFKITCFENCEKDGIFRRVG